MSETKSESGARQEPVYIDVGGKTFKMLRQTIRNYPDSLLAKLLREYPRSGQQGDPLYIDRNPKTFEWILEIYRDGDFEGTMPDKSAKYLQRELDFYQLPSLDELNLSTNSCELSFSARSVSKRLVREIVAEIKESGLEDMFPWCVYIYHEFSLTHLQPRRRILVVPEAIWGADPNQKLGFFKKRKHDDFISRVNGPKLYLRPETLYPYGYMPNFLYAVQPPTTGLIEIIKDEARRLGFSLEARNLGNVQDNSNGKNMEFRDLPFLRFDIQKK